MTHKLNNPFQQALLIEAQATYYPHMVSVYLPKQPILRRPTADPKRLRGAVPKLEDDAEASTKETHYERSTRRTKKRISDYALCNAFDMFVTFTFRDDRTNNERTRQQMRDWLKNQRNRNGKFQYLLVPEFHKDGEALHFHALFNAYPGKLTRATHQATNRPILQKGKQIYTLNSYTLGFNNVKLLGQYDEDRSRVAAYIQKYITKDMPVFHGKQRYWASKGLLLPRVEDNPQEWYQYIEPDWQTETANGTILRFNHGTHPLSDMFLEAYQ